MVKYQNDYTTSSRVYSFIYLYAVSKENSLILLIHRIIRLIIEIMCIRMQFHFFLEGDVKLLHWPIEVSLAWELR